MCKSRVWLNKSNAYEWMYAAIIDHIFKKIYTQIGKRSQSSLS